VTDSPRDWTIGAPTAHHAAGRTASPSGWPRPFPVSSTPTCGTGQAADQSSPTSSRLPRQLRPDNDHGQRRRGGTTSCAPRCSPDRWHSGVCDDALARMVATGADVVVFTGFDTRKVPVLSTIRGRIATFKRADARHRRQHGCIVVDPVGHGAASEPVVGGRDRLHLTPDGTAVSRYVRARCGVSRSPRIGASP